MGIFKACDIRGVYGRDLTDDIVYRIGRALGTLLGNKFVVVGGDVRVSTPVLKSALTCGLVESGASVLDVGIIPTPVFYFARDHLTADAGAMITASHNPPEFNGLKLVIGPLPITEEELDIIKRLSESGKFTRKKGSIQAVDVISLYKSFIHSIAPVTSGVRSSKVVIDCGNGCYSTLAPEVFREIGYQVEELFCTADGSFPNRDPNTAVPENLSALRRKVRETKAMLGVAFDGDGDRISFVDNRGRFLTGDKAISILAKYILTDVPGGKVVYDLKCSSVVPKTVAEAGGIPIPERSGHTFIKTRMIEEDASFGGELSGHYFYRELFGADDGLYSALFMANLLLETGSNLSELADSIPEYAVTPDIRIPFSGDRAEIIERIAAGFPPCDVSRLDGVKVDFPEGWGLARISVTEPAITFRFEAETQDQLHTIIDRFLESTPEFYEPVMKAAAKAADNKLPEDDT